MHTHPIKHLRRVSLDGLDMTNTTATRRRRKVTKKANTPNILVCVIVRNNDNRVCTRNNLRKLTRNNFPANSHFFLIRTFFRYQDHCRENNTHKREHGSTHQRIGILLEDQKQKFLLQIFCYGRKRSVSVTTPRNTS